MPTFRYSLLPGKAFYVIKRNILDVIKVRFLRSPYINALKEWLKRAMKSNMWTEGESSDTWRVRFRYFSTDRKNNFSESQKYFTRVEKNFKTAGKINFFQERPGELKSYGKNFSQKINIL